MPDGQLRLKSPPHPGGSRLIGVQYLRALGALMVAHFHATIQIPAYTRYFDRYLIGSAHLANGVDLFFVISGFIMLVSSQKTRPGEFLTRRVIRIVPLYWVLTILVAGAASRRPELFRATTVNLEYMVKSLLFIPYSNPAQNGDVVPLLVPGWSLNFEMFFYVLFAASLFLPRRLRLPMTGALFAVLVASNRLFDMNDRFPALGFLCSMRLFEFWMGMLIGHLFVEKALRMPKAIAWLSVFGGFMMLLFGTPVPVVAGSPAQFLLESMLPSVAIVLGTVWLDQHGHVPHTRGLAHLGDASYSIYLSHILSLGVARVVWKNLHLQRDSAPFAILFATFGMAIVLVGSSLAYRYLETPMMNAMQRWYRQRRTAAGAVPLR